MERVNEILTATMHRYRNYYDFGEMSENEFFIRLAVLADISADLEDMAEETYGGEDGE
jgi:hypothetical protein